MGIVRCLRAEPWGGKICGATAHLESGKDVERTAMEYGAHLPLIDFDGGGRTLDDLREFTRAAHELDYKFLCANDHLVFQRPWLDGPTALAAVLPESGEMALATTVAIPIVRGPVTSAKTLAAIDILSGGRLIVGVGPGSSARDYELAQIPFEERWKRLEEVIPALRALWTDGAEPFDGKYYSTQGITLEPHPTQQPAGPPIWVGSWGSVAGLRRVARLGDGWLASAYNTDPNIFAKAWSDLRGQLEDRGKDPDAFPNGIATMWTYVTESRSEADRILTEVVAPMLNRDPDQLRALLPIGPAEECAAKISAYARSGAQRIFLWPMADEPAQLELFMDRVAPLVE